MISYLTLEDLTRFKKALAEDRAQILLKAANQRSPSGNTFLSHSSKDAAQLPMVIDLLENHGASAYVDKKDETLPPYTSRETASILRSRIKECKKFILFSTKNSKDSKWMPWELGVSDGLKSSLGVAILPALELQTERYWTEQEYLGIYDRIVWGNLEGHNDPLWIVLNQEKNTATTLREWLRR